MTPICRQSLYSLLADEVMENARALDHCYKDTRQDEQLARLAIVQRLQETLSKMLEVI